MIGSSPRNFLEGKQFVCKRFICGKKGLDEAGQNQAWYKKSK